jgi:predicted NBD/HSP70 family sugar kinase
MYLAIDLGGSKVQAAVFKNDEIVWEIYEATRSENIQTVIAQIGRIIKEATLFGQS